MYFLDNSAHIFELPDYNKKPIGYDFDEQDYIFWFEDANDNTRLSINNYYGKIINVLYEVSNISDFDDASISSLYNIDITCDSENFKLIKAIDFQNSLKEQKSILEYIDINNQTKILSSENDEDILVIKVTQDNKKFIMIPLYVIGTSKYSGTWLTNILIHISHKIENKHIWCPITIGGIFNDEYEALVIHGKNMGVNLPKDILKALNGTSYDNDVFDEELYNKKIKEYLLNYMSIKGELGNYNSAIKSLNWFGYQNTVELYKLLETDNEFQTQYIRDYFDIQQDIIQAYNYFLNSQFVGLKYKLNEETGENYKQNLNNTFWGEGLPILTDHDNQYTMKHTHEFLGEESLDGNQQFKYSSTYMNYSLYELMFKLSYLKYYYQTYFLPIFIILKNMNIEYKVYSVPNKYLTYSYDHIYEEIINNQSQNNYIEFSKEHELYFTHQLHFVDEYFNEYNLSNEHYTNDKKYYYEINDTCLFVPVSIIMEKTIKYHSENSIDIIKHYYGTSSEQIINSINEYENSLDNIYQKEIIKDELTNGKYCNCLLILKDKDLNKTIYSSKFSFINNENNKYLGFVFYPKMINELSSKLYTYINKNYVLYLNVNNKWHEYEFISKIPEFDVHVGTLEYKYWNNNIIEFNKIYNSLAHKDNQGNNTNDTQIIFTIYNKDNNDDIINLDITDYIINNDFFDIPSKFFSNFSQIDDIIEDNDNPKNSKVIFNTYMNDYDLIYRNDLNFGLWKKLLKNNNITTTDEIDLCIKNSISELINNHRSQINILNNYKYLNNIHLYYLYALTDKPDLSINILRYKQDLSVLCGNIYIKKIHINNTFVITKLSEIITDNPNDNTTNTLGDYNYYLLTSYDKEYLDLDTYISNINSFFYLKQKNNNEYSYYFILERNSNGLTGNNADSLYSYYNDINGQKNIGYIICPIKNNQIILNNVYLHGYKYDYQLNTGYKIDNLKIGEYHNNIYYTDNGYTYNVLFKFTPVTKNKIYLENINNIADNYTIYDSQNHYNSDEIIYAKLDLYYYEQTKILNLYGYYNDIFCEDFNDTDPDNVTCTVNFSKILDENGERIYNIDPIYNVKLHKSSKLIEYVDIENNTSNGGISINESNPSLYWTSIDDIDNENNNINTFIGLDIQHENYQEQEIKYINYLCQDLTGLKGSYIIDILIDNEISTSDIIELVVEITDENNQKTTYSNINNNKFTVNGNEKLIIAYFKFNNDLLILNSDVTFTPGIHPYSVEYAEIQYTGNEMEEDERNKDLVDLYKTFFYKKYTITMNNKNNQSEIRYKKEIWDSYIQLDSNNNYDTYLMHGYIDKNHTNDNDPQSWYFMFISKNTCDNVNIINTMNNYPKEIKFKNYLLKHITTKQLFLINRMNVNYTDNVYHFDGNNMIVCSLYNNKMLPINTNLMSKWKLTPISYGAKSNNVIYANSNTAIISIPNANTYDKGYYNLQINYSLDGNITNYQTINKKILIK